MNTRWAVTIAVITASTLYGAVQKKAASSTSESAGAEATEMMSYEATQKAAAEGRAKDAQWKPVCESAGVIQVGSGETPGQLKNFCLNAEGNILACFAPNETNTATAKESPGILVYSPEGKLLKTMPLEIRPTAICVSKEGAIYVAGQGKLLKLNVEGKVLASAASPVAESDVVIGKDVEEMVQEMIKNSRPSRDFKSELAKIKTMLEKRRSDVTGLSATEQDVFMAVPAPSDFSYRIYRFDQELKNPKLVVEKLRGCCGQMDVQTHAGKLWIPHNARHAVETRDRDGGEVAKFGKAGRVKPSDFGGCCEPKNLRVLANGDILAAESGPPTCIKRFSANGKFKEVVAVAEGAKGDCVRVTVEMSPDGKRYYLMDTTKDAIRVFKSKS